MAAQWLIYFSIAVRRYLDQENLESIYLLGLINFRR